MPQELFPVEILGGHTNICELVYIIKYAFIWK